MTTNQCSLLALLLCLSGCTGAVPIDAKTSAIADVPNEAAAPSLTAEMPSPSGRFQTFSTTGSIDQTNPFFVSLGSNGRACVHCHQPQDAWTITPDHLKARFEATSPKGIDPVFRTVDGSNSPVADVSTEEARRAAYSMLLNKGLIRVGIGVPEYADFELIAVDDPYGYASTAELSLFRRPLPSTNLKFLATVMWDGRETFKEQTISFDLMHQSNAATLGHAQAAQAIDPATQTAIVNFEMTLFTAVTFDNDAKQLNAKQGLGGPSNVAAADFHIGINDVLGADPAPNAPPFSPDVFHTYDAWSDAADKFSGTDAARGAVVRGQALFNRKPINIAGVKGLNDALGADVIPGTCTTCHDTPSAGNHSVSLPIDIGLADESRRTPDMPLYTFHLKGGADTDVIRVTDPGRALISGRFRDIGKFKGPILRGLAARAPYFHNGSAATLMDAVEFYNDRFALHLTQQQKDDLVAFLNAL
jgi:cytochrome c peroxidase